MVCPELFFGLFKSKIKNYHRVTYATTTHDNNKKDPRGIFPEKKPSWGFQTSIPIDSRSTRWFSWLIPIWISLGSGPLSLAGRVVVVNCWVVYPPRETNIFFPPTGKFGKSSSQKKIPCYRDMLFQWGYLCFYNVFFLFEGAVFCFCWLMCLDVFLLECVQEFLPKTATWSRHTWILVGISVGDISTGFNWVKLCFCLFMIGSKQSLTWKMWKTLVVTDSSSWRIWARHTEQWTNQRLDGCLGDVRACTMFRWCFGDGCLGDVWCS